MEEVVLVNEENEVLGTVPKAEVYGEETPLHRAFSAFLFNAKGELLLQQRSHKKKTWPLVWSNSCCGHPMLNEENTAAAKRRIRDELGLEVDYIEEVAPYRYKFTKDGVMENEICPILVGFVSQEVRLNEDEVEDIEWIKWKDYVDRVKNNPQQYSPWSVEETLILNKNERFKELLEEKLN